MATGPIQRFGLAVATGIVGAAGLAGCAGEKAVPAAERALVVTAMPGEISSATVPDKFAAALNHADELCTKPRPTTKRSGDAATLATNQWKADYWDCYGNQAAGLVLKAKNPQVRMVLRNTAIAAQTRADAVQRLADNARWKIETGG